MSAALQQLHQIASSLCAQGADLNWYITFSNMRSAKHMKKNERYYGGVYSFKEPVIPHFTCWGKSYDEVASKLVKYMTERRESGKVAA